ncbi:MAG TPA: bifunctional [glutamine synthetase] adenylyltransferase/[glutamine synthetase]-adenylyl-L-tyrosine phosphorylase, partial [Hyphomicrobiaceae bacterium]|nr:bifunctional [glutamine synthetase] adenylyltransferase/[glutamine synthetase]-adenylyl-L-tyrosine phosphorylase [Hyphomicrobiaceae bacterium]
MTQRPAALEPLWKRIARAPLGADEAHAQGLLAEIEAGLAGDPAARLLAEPRVRALIGGVFAGSPYLSGLIRRDPPRLVRLLSSVPEEHLKRLCEEAAAAAAGSDTAAEVMARLRRLRSEAALLVALADLAGVWGLEQVTGALTGLADAAVGAAVVFLF